MRPPAHWRQPLADGRIEFLFADGEGNRLTGNVSCDADVDRFQRCFEFTYELRLPIPDWRPPYPHASQPERRTTHARV